jgi:hypothetical protein
LPRRPPAGVGADLPRRPMRRRSVRWALGLAGSGSLAASRPISPGTRWILAESRPRRRLRDGPERSRPPRGSRPRSRRCLLRRGPGRCRARGRPPRPARQTDRPDPQTPAAPAPLTAGSTATPSPPPHRHRRTTRQLRHQPRRAQHLVEGGLTRLVDRGVELEDVRRGVRKHGPGAVGGESGVPDSNRCRHGISPNPRAA